MQALPRILKQGTAKFHDNEVDVAILNNKTRVIIGDGVQNNAFVGELPSFIETYKSHARTLTAYIDIAEDKIIPVTTFESQSGEVSTGYNCVVLAEISDAYYKYSNHLHRSGQQPTKDYEDAIIFAGDLLVNLAYIGVIALVDEATGYEKIRSQTALQDTLQERLSDPFTIPLTSAKS